METVGVNVIETAALGRPFQLGMLYDCRKDALIPGITLWDPENLQKSLRVRRQINTDFKVTASDSIEDKSALMNIDSSLKLSVIGGLINVTGAAKYLKDTKKSFKQQRLTLHYHSTCRFEELTMTHLAPENIVYQDVFDNDTATHVVTAVLYGADACFLFDREVSEDEEKTTIEGEAKLALEKLKGVSVGVNFDLKMSDTERKAFQKFTCTFYGDFQLPSNPTSFEDGLNVFTDLPNHLGENNERAVPLRVWLYPLDKLHTRASKLQKEISIDLIQSTESVIESLNTAEMKCSDLLKDSPASTFKPFSEKIMQMKQNCYNYKLRLMKSLRSLLPNIRGNVTEETALNELLQEHENSPFSKNDLKQWVKEREQESKVIKSVLRQLKDAGAQAEENIDDVWMDLEYKSLVVYTFTSMNGSDVLLTQQNVYLKTSGNRENLNDPDTKQKSWLTPDLTKTMKSHLNIFKTLIDLNDTESHMFVVSAKEMESNPGSCILLYEGDEAVCFIPPSKPSCPIAEEVNENTVDLKVPPPCADTLELRLLYKRRQDSDWTDKPLLKGQDTVTVTDLNSGTEYEFKCAALGKLNYTVDSDIIRVTTQSMTSDSRSLISSTVVAEDSPNVDILAELGKLKNMEDRIQKLEETLAKVSSENEALKTLVQDSQKLNEVSKVAFSAGLSASGSKQTGPYTDEKTLVYKKVFSNVGNAYDSNTGIFTAPVKGVYFFRFYAHCHTGTTLAVTLFKNGARQCSVHDWKPKGSGNGNASNGVVLTLEPGDQINTKLWRDKQVFDDGESYTSFGGFLIFPL